MICKIPFIFAVYFTHPQEGKIFPTPRNIVSNWKVTFSDCLKLSNRNVLPSCTLTFTARLLSLTLWFEHIIYFIVFSQVLIILALLSIENARKISRVSVYSMCIFEGHYSIR